MGDERRDDAADRRRADVYSSARIGAAAALALVLDVAVPDYDIIPGILLPLLWAILALLGPRGLGGLEGREVTTVTALLTNKAYGNPSRGARRCRKPTILACLHQSANAKATALHERNYANRASSSSPSATAYIGDGTIARAIDPVKYAALEPRRHVAHPTTKLPTIATVTVKAGDTLNRVAAAHELTLAALLAFPENAKYPANPGLIHPGDIVRVK